MSEQSDFLEWRTRGIGASDIAGILGISPWASPFTVWASKVLPAPMGSGSGESEAMAWGKLLESVIISESARRLRLTPYGEQTRCEHPVTTWARATVDAFCDDGDTKGVIEAKTTGEPYWAELPDYYEAQVLWQLEVTGRAFGWVAALHAGRKMTLWRVDAQPELQTRLIETARRFWDGHVLTGIPPKLDGSAGTGRTLDALYASGGGETVELDTLTDELAALRRIRADIKTLERDKTALENTVKAALGNADAGTVDGKVAVTWRPQHTRRIDLDLLREKYPAEAADCESTTETRRLLVKPLAKSSNES